MNAGGVPNTCKSNEAFFIGDSSKMRFDLVADG